MSFRYDAKEYDKGRTGEDVDYWVDEAVRIARLSEASKVLDFGCGTGNYTFGFLRTGVLGSVCGLEPAFQMVAAARAKDAQRLVYWCVGTGEGIPFCNGSFDCVFSSQVWHHLKDKESAASECFRVLKDKSPVVIRTISHEQWRRKTVTRFFPEVVELELRRYPSDEAFERIFVDAGFSRVEFRRYALEQYTSADEYIEVATKKLWSMFWHLSDESIRRGIAKLTEYKASNPNIPLRNDDLITLVIAWK